MVNSLFDCNEFRVNWAEKANYAHLAQRPTSIKTSYSSKEHYQMLLLEAQQGIGQLQEMLYAYNRYAVLLIFQGMDSAGKGSVIKHVMSGINPQGCQVFSFQQPSVEELDHDFLWRSNKRLPERGRIGIFDRSYYEEVITVRAMPGLLEQQHLPPECVDLNNIWAERLHDILHLESYLHRNGIQIIKFFLHLSKEEQRQRLMARINEPSKNWKIGQADLEARKHWEAYQLAYDECLGATSTHHAPWYVIPADDKRNARLLVSHIIVKTLQALKMTYPILSKDQLKELAAIKQSLENEKTPN